MSQITQIQTAFRLQAIPCKALGSPFTARLCDLFAQRKLNDSKVARAIYGWRADPGITGDALPLRVTGALHALVLEQRSSELAAVYPPNHETVNDDALWSAIQSALNIDDNEDFVLNRLQNAPQTNEVRRSAVLMPGFLTIASLTKLPLVLSELGASAGLNLFCNQFAYRLGAMRCGNADSTVQIEPEWHGTAPPGVSLKIESRAACDISPLDPTNEKDRLRMLSYIWPDQNQRIERTKAALTLAANSKPRVEKLDVVNWLKKRLAAKYENATHVIYHTIAWQYFGAEKKAAAEALIKQAGENASHESPLAWLSFENLSDKPYAELTLTLWPTGEKQTIAQADAHCRWVKWFGWSV